MARVKPFRRDGVDRGRPRDGGRHRKPVAIPGIAAQNGGAAFLIPWVIFLFIWSLPLLVAEFGLGRGAPVAGGGRVRDAGGREIRLDGRLHYADERHDSVLLLGRHRMTLKYFLATLTTQLQGVDSGTYWETYSASIWQPILFHILAVSMGGFIIGRGIARGIERANRVLIPTLFVLLLVAAVRAMTLPGAERGLEFLFNPDLSTLKNYRTWLEALTQSAWSTGAGWGLILTYAIYMKHDEDVVLNATTIGFGNNSASLLAGMAVLPTVFAILPTNDALAAMESGNTGSHLHLDSAVICANSGGSGLPAAVLSRALLRGALVAHRDDRAGNADPHRHRRPA